MQPLAPGEQPLAPRGPGLAMAAGLAIDAQQGGLALMGALCASRPADPAGLLALVYWHGWLLPCMHLGMLAAIVLNCLALELDLIRSGLVRAARTDQLRLTDQIDPARPQPAWPLRARWLASQLAMLAGMDAGALLPHLLAGPAGATTGAAALLMMATGMSAGMAVAMMVACPPNLRGLLPNVSAG